MSVPAKRPRLVFFGTPEFAVPALTRLQEADFDIAAVVTQPDRPQGRGRKLAPSAVKSAALKLGLTDIRQPTKLDNGFAQDVGSLQADFYAVVAFGMILPPELLGLAPDRFINIHPSLLPKWRGAAPIQAALLAGDKETGVSLMIIDNKMDHGPLLAQTTVPITDEDTTATLGEKLSHRGAELLVRSVPGWLGGTIAPRPQDHSQATFCRQLQKEDGFVDWQEPAAVIAAKVRAFNPWPLVHANWRGEAMKIYRVRMSDKSLPVGQISIDQPTGRIYIGTGTTALEVLELQLPGKKRLPAAVFINGLH